VQGTVRSYDETAGSGTVFTDDGTVLAFPAAALAGTGLRLLRPGQRVRFRLDGRGAVAALTLATFPLPPPPADPLPPG
jgi:2-phospho-L-lactate guanylyltransferase